MPQDGQSGIHPTTLLENRRRPHPHPRNSGRYLLGNLQSLDKEDFDALAVEGPMGPEELAELPLPERYIISKCHALTAEVTAGLEAYNMADAGQQIYQFLWDEYADWYIESSKTRMVSSRWRYYAVHAVLAVHAVHASDAFELASHTSNQTMESSITFWFQR